ncbi:MAG: DNA repair protein RadA [Clostridiaceae bacterium]|nr:DNA repair protein RadA [Clostridiaceae bacterium]
MSARQKASSVYICQECGYESHGWLGKCPVCSQWNTFIEEIVQDSPGSRLKDEINAVGLAGMEVETEKRYSTGIQELDRVLGGGIVRGSLVLVAGDPGIGKSTLLLQVCDRIEVDGAILYISGEESIRQIKLRADRLNVKNPRITVACETNLEFIEKLIMDKMPGITIIDSIQTIYNEEMASPPGTISQVKETTSALMRMAKRLNIPMVIVGHVTKEGAIAGPKVLEHMVDTVLYFEGERHLSYRVLRAVKNRFGSTNEIGIFEMKETGLEEVENPSMAMLSERPKNVPGSVVVPGMEGTRPMLVEIQALVCPTSFNIPRRMTTGVDYNRATLLMAILEKRANLHLRNFDAYINVVGGLRVEEPASDLGIAVAIASSFKNMHVSPDMVITGEVGLTGEVRAVNKIETRVNEAMRIGFETCMVPAGNMKMLEQSGLDKKVSIIPVKSIQEVLDFCFK